MSFRFKYLHQIVGAFLFISFAILVIAGYLMASEKKLFEKMVAYHTVIDRGDGISTHTSLTLKGIEIGYIDDIHMTDDGQIHVSFKVYPEFAGHIRGFTYVKIGSASLLGGKMIEIIPSVSGQIVATGTKLPTDKDQIVQDYLAKQDIKPSDDTSQKINSILANVEVITHNLKIISGQFKNPDGSIQMSLHNIANITGNVAVITGALKEKTPEVKSIIVDAKSAAQDTNQMIHATKESTVFRALTPTPAKPKASENMIHLDPRNSNQ
jgi:ABC-type transporter Mla subunit MlaD